MDYQNISVGLDIGTTKIVAIVGRKNEHDKVEILGVGKAKSLGVHRGVVSNITQTINSIQEAVQEAERSSGVEIKDVVVGIAGQHIRSLQHSDYITRENNEEVINEEDIDKLINQVHKLVMLPGEEIIHVLPQEYKVDGQAEIREPVGMYGRRLEANFHVVVGHVSSIKNIARCVKSAGLNLAGITLEPLASAEAVLGYEEKEAGVALVDIGGGTTDIAIFKDNIIRHTAVIPFGGNIITEDIKAGCSIIERQAELLKVKFGSAWPGENSETEIVSIPGLRGREPKEISLKTLSEIINARVREIMEQTYLEIKNYGHDEQKKKLIAGIVMTGGGSKLKHIRQLTEFITGMDVRIGLPNEHLAGGQSENLSSPEFATATGLLIKGLERKTNVSESTEADIIIDEMQSEVEEVVSNFDQPIAETQAVKESHSEMKKEVERRQEPKGITFFEKWADKFRQMFNETE